MLWSTKLSRLIVLGNLIKYLSHVLSYFPAQIWKMPVTPACAVSSSILSNTVALFLSAQHSRRTPHWFVLWIHLGWVAISYFIYVYGSCLLLSDPRRTPPGEAHIIRVKDDPFLSPFKRVSHFLQSFLYDCTITTRIYLGITTPIAIQVHNGRNPREM